MAHFIGYLQGNRGQASRLGTERSGMDAVARGWHIGGEIMLGTNSESRNDWMEIRIDGGSSGPRQAEIIARTSEGENGPRELCLYNPKTGEEIYRGTF